MKFKGQECWFCTEGWCFILKFFFSPLRRHSGFISIGNSIVASVCGGHKVTGSWLPSETCAVFMPPYSVLRCPAQACFTGFSRFVKLRFNIGMPVYKHVIVFIIQAFSVMTRTSVLCSKSISFECPKITSVRHSVSHVRVILVHLSTDLCAEKPIRTLGKWSCCVNSLKSGDFCSLITADVLEPDESSSHLFD